ncbi:hypothetical protein CA984_16460 [Streptosporangium minutum]|uniref:Uncharacterized protein n=1 Tax=Streptosporangium minutum TaxID=569862 RepID=A0A243RP23_9ACTN|nr:hypothetical protein CA984_16460 [Streptosporangium minutum]
MKPPNNAEGSSPCQDSTLNSAPYNANNAAYTVARKRRARHVPGQVPIVLAATIYPPAYGMSQALIVPDETCPGCSCWHSHRIKYPAPVLVFRKARCGARYELALRKPAVKRGRRAA